MIYKEFKDMKLSSLGFGAMRLPVIDGDNSRIDERKAFELFDLAYERGVNYFDTAWNYHDGSSEPVLGRALARYDRSSFHLSSKFPGWDAANFPRTEEIFNEQLRRCGVEYFDFYLLHSVKNSNLESYLTEGERTVEYLLKQREAGRIRHLGFSCHAWQDGLVKMLDKYGEVMEFCQIQLNYFDWTYQHADEKVRLLNERGLPIWVMEPVRGGRLVHLPASAMAELEAMRPGESAPGWAFRFIQSVPGVTMVLSGMNSAEQVRENTALFSEPKPLSAAEFDALVDLGRRLAGSGMIPCTGCRYCVPGCPAGLEIPALLNCANELRFTGKAPDAVSSLTSPAGCLSCHACSGVCPQEIKIPEILAELAGAMA